MTTPGAPRAVVAGEGAQAENAALTPYLPRPVIEWLTESTDDRYREVAGSVAFVDISGFTKLSERLAKQGKVGAEELSDTIDRCFVDLLAVAYDRQGSLLKFGGDALLLFFSGDGHERRACQAALGMRRELRTVGRTTVSGNAVSLRMSVGVHSGRFNFFLVGDSHREFVVTGPATSTTVAMESTAEAGEIVVSADTARALRPAWLGPAKGEGWLLRRPPLGPAAERPPGVSAGPGVRLADFVPVALRESLVAGALEPEHRRVTVAFVHFDGTDALLERSGPEAMARHLDVLVGDAQRAADRQGIAFLGTDIDRDGGKIILTAGAPTTSGDDEHRMLVALREIVDADRSLPVRIGVNRGDVFAGHIGPPYRRTFTVMGDAVNLAARLMAKALPGQILTTSGVLERSQAQVFTTELEPFFVKGKAQPVHAFSVEGVASARQIGGQSKMPLVGRQRELEALHGAVESARRGQGSVLELVGEPGVGKSRLVEELRLMAGDMTQISVSCEPYESSTPYYAFRQLAEAALDLPVDDDDRRVVELEHRVRGLAPELVPWVPLLGAVVDLAIPDTAETAQLLEHFRRPRLAQVVTQLLRAAMSSATLVTVEDTHWMDEASAELLTSVAAGIDRRPWLVCASRRREDSSFSVPTSEGSVSLDLQPLDERDAAELVHLVSRESPIPPHVMAALAQRSGGNPLFVRELLATASGPDGIDALPDSIEAVIATRIDRLSPLDRNLLRRASVLGRSFSRELLEAVLDEPPDDDFQQRLSGFLSSDGSGTLSFDHALLRDGAYDGLAFRLRRQLHARVAERILEIAGGDPEDEAEVVSLHYLQAQRFEEAWRYSLVAAERAKGMYANVESAEFYERALAAARHLPGLAADQLAAIYEALGDAHERAGAYGDAASAYRGARRLVKGDPVGEARLVLRLSRVMGWLDRYSGALRWITKGLHILDDVPGTEAARQRAQLLAWYGRFCQEQGHHARAEKWCRLAVVEAEQAGEKDALANALKVLAWASIDLGTLVEADHLTRALALFEELGDVTGQASVLNLLGVFAYFRGEWGEALDSYLKAQEMVKRTGNPVMEAFYMNNIGEIALEQGRLDEADHLFTGAWEIWQAAGYRSGVAYALCNRGRVALAQARYEEALALFVQSRDESHAIGGHADALEAEARMAECLFRSGKVQDALAQVAEALDRARVLGGVSAQNALLYRVRGAALLDTGDVDDARQALEMSLAAARVRNARYDEALTLRALGELESRVGGPAGDELLEQSQALFDQLGVVWTPDPLMVAPGTPVELSSR